MSQQKTRKKRKTETRKGRHINIAETEKINKLIENNKFDFNNFIEKEKEEELEKYS